MAPPDKDTEAWQLARFGEAIPDFPAGEVIAREEPDFVVHAASTVLGVELTGLFRAVEPGKPPLRGAEQLRWRVCSAASAVAERESAPPRDVVVTFSRSARLTKRRVPEVAAAVVRLVRALDVPEGASRTVEYAWHDRDRFPDELIAVRVSNSGRHGVGHWQPAEATLVPDCTAAQLQAAIDRKRAHYAPYRAACDAVWLVLVADGFAPSSTFSLPEAAVRAVYTGPFERVYYFENFSRAATRLRIARDGWPVHGRVQ